MALYVGCPAFLIVFRRLIYKVPMINRYRFLPWSTTIYIDQKSKHWCKWTTFSVDFTVKFWKIHTIIPVMWIRFDCIRSRIHKIWWIRIRTQSGSRSIKSPNWFQDIFLKANKKLWIFKSEPKPYRLATS